MQSLILSSTAPLLCLVACTAVPAEGSHDSAPSRAAVDEASLELATVEVNGVVLDAARSADDLALSLSLLAQQANVTVTSVDPRVRIEASSGELGTGRLTLEFPLVLGENELSFALSAPGAADGGAAQGEIRLHLERSRELWRDVQLLTAEPPAANGYFGDYLTASDDFLYVNSARRGQLYRHTPQGFEFERPSEQLLAMELEWMYEAALSDDALAFVAQPLGAEVTLYVFNASADQGWLLAGEYVTSGLGTVRLAADDLVFVDEGGVRFLRRENAEWRWAQSIAAPVADSGFGSRPTYFDAAGIAFSGEVLVVGAPLEDVSPTVADTPAPAEAAPAERCTADTVGCLHDAGAVYVYEREASTNEWQQSARLVSSNPAMDQHFGAATAVFGDWIAVGAPQESSAEPGVRTLPPDALSSESLAESGAVTLFRRSAGAWHNVSSIKLSHVAAHDYFGDSLLLRGDTLLVAAPGLDNAAGMSLNDHSATDSGGIVAFVLDGDEWSEVSVNKLAPALAPPFPFPDQMRFGGGSLLVAANSAPYVEASGVVREFAGRVYFLR